MNLRRSQQRHIVRQEGAALGEQFAFVNQGGHHAHAVGEFTHRTGLSVIIG